MPRNNRLNSTRFSFAEIIALGSLLWHELLLGDENRPADRMAAAELKIHVERYRTTIRPLLKKLCFDCHGEKKQESDFRVDVLDPTELLLTKIDHWVDIGDRLKSGTMPPRKAAQPPRDELSAIIAWLADYLRYAESAAEAEEPLRLRRMTVDQYDFAMQDLLGISLNFKKDLPPESVATFD